MWRLPAPVHVKLETGMGRTGLLLSQADSFFERLLQSRGMPLGRSLLPFLHLLMNPTNGTPIFSLPGFARCSHGFEGFAKQPTLIHMASSGAILDLPESTFDAVRSGNSHVRPLSLPRHLAIASSRSKS